MPPASRPRWEEALEAQHDLWRFWGTPEGKKYAEAFGQSIRRVDGTVLVGDFTHSIAEIERRTMFQAAPFYVSDDIRDLLEVAAESFELEPLLHTDILTANGFVYLPRALVVPDRNGKRMSFRAFSWHPIVRSGREVPSDPSIEDLDGILLSIYSHIDDDDDFSPELRTYRDAGNALGINPDLVPDLGLSHMQLWWFNTDVAAAVQKGHPGDEKAIESAVTMMRYLQVFFRLSQQYLSQRVREPTSRPTARAMKRAGYTPSEVTVVRLRRKRVENPDKEERNVEWTHRWIVNGFWRNQWYPSIQGHRQIWVNAFVKGPADKELRLPKQRVFDFSR